MDDLRPSAVAARLVAWHNRHPLARRITAANVHAIGYVALPFAGLAPADAMAGAADEAPPAAGSSLRELAQARARQSAPEGSAAAAAASPRALASSAVSAAVPADARPDFSEDFIDPLSPRAVAAFAARVGRCRARPPADGPLRQVRADGGQPQLGRIDVYLLTAAIETATRRSRLLLGAGDAPAVLGRRIYSTPRLGAVAGVLLACAAVAFGLLRPAHEATGDAAAVAASTPALAETMAPALVAASASALVAASTPALRAASTPALAAASAVPADPPHAPEAADATVAAAHGEAGASAARHGTAGEAAALGAQPAAEGPAGQPPTAGLPGQPPDATPRLGRVDMPQLRPRFGDRSRNADAADAAAAAAPPGAPAVAPAAAAGPSLALSPVRSPAPTTATPAAAAAPAAARVNPVFALSSRRLRTRAEAEQVTVAMKSLLATVSLDALRVDMLPEGDDWRVVGYPFPRRGDADKARALLVSRGLRIEVVDF